MKKQGVFFYLYFVVSLHYFLPCGHVEAELHAKKSPMKGRRIESPSLCVRQPWNTAHVLVSPPCFLRLPGSNPTAATNVTWAELQFIKTLTPTLHQATALVRGTNPFSYFITSNSIPGTSSNSDDQQQQRRTRRHQTKDETTS